MSFRPTAQNSRYIRASLTPATRCHENHYVLALSLSEPAPLTATGRPKFVECDVAWELSQNLLGGTTTTGDGELGPRSPAGSSFTERLLRCAAVAQAESASRWLAHPARPGVWDFD